MGKHTGPTNLNDTHEMTAERFNTFGRPQKLSQLINTTTTGGIFDRYVHCLGFGLGTIFTQIGNRP